MKKLIALCFAALTAMAAFAADALPVFNATLTVGKDNRFVLIGSDGKPSSWLQIGDTFEGYKLNTYDPKTATLEIEHDGKVSKLNLASDAAVGAGKLPSTPATLADAEAVLNRMHFDKMMEKMLGQQKVAMGRMVEQMSARMNVPPESRSEFVEFQKKMMDEMMSALKPHELQGDMARIFSEVYTKEELDGLSAFYSTPVGEALNEKQPVIQQKLQEVMMPRMMAVMPKIQQMAQEFAMQQKAKQAAAAATATTAATAASPAPAAAPTAAAAPAPAPKK